MEGVEILSSAQAVAETAFNWTAFWIAFGVTLAFCLFLGIWHVANGECEWWLILITSLIGIIGGMMMGCMFGSVCETPTTYETHYKVTIDDSVSMNEFLDKYEIIDQEGKIYTVKEKEE